MAYMTNEHEQLWADIAEVLKADGFSLLECTFETATAATLPQWDHGPTGGQNEGINGGAAPQTFEWQTPQMAAPTVLQPTEPSSQTWASGHRQCVALPKTINVNKQPVVVRKRRELPPPKSEALSIKTSKSRKRTREEQQEEDQPHRKKLRNASHSAAISKDVGKKCVALPKTINVNMQPVVILKKLDLPPPKSEALSIKTSKSRSCRKRTRKEQQEEDQPHRKKLRNASHSAAIDKDVGKKCVALPKTINVNMQPVVVLKRLELPPPKSEALSIKTSKSRKRTREEQQECVSEERRLRPRRRSSL